MTTSRRCGRGLERRPPPQGLGNGRIGNGGGSFTTAGRSGSFGAVRGALHHAGSGHLGAGPGGGMQRAYSLTSQLPQPPPPHRHHPLQPPLQHGQGGGDGGQLVGCLAVALWALPCIRSAVMDLQVPLTATLTAAAVFTSIPLHVRGIGAPKLWQIQPQSSFTV